MFAISMICKNTCMRKIYASDISPEKFVEIEPLLQSIRRRTKPTSVDLYEVFCAVLYVLRTGCQWHFLSSEWLKWQMVYSYFSKWSEPDQDAVSVWAQALKNQVGAARNACSTFLIVEQIQRR